MRIGRYRVHPLLFTPIILVIYLILAWTSLVHTEELTIEPGTGWGYGYVGRDGSVYRWSWESTETLEWELWSYSSSGPDEDTVLDEGIDTSASGSYRQEPNWQYDFGFDNCGDRTAQLELTLVKRFTYEGSGIMSILVSTVVIWPVGTWLYLKRQIPPRPP